MNPITKVTEPQSMSASDAPRRSEAKPTGDTLGRLAAGDGGAAAAAAGGASEGGMARWGERRMVRSRAQSS